MTEHEIAAEHVLRYPIEPDRPVCPPVDYAVPRFERHELIAMAACVGIGALFALAVHFLPVVAAWMVRS